MMANDEAMPVSNSISVSSVNKSYLNSLPQQYTNHSLYDNVELSQSFYGGPGATATDDLTNLAPIHNDSLTL